MAFQAGSIFAEMELDTSPMVKGLKDASKALNDFAKSVKEKIEKTEEPVKTLSKRIVDLGKRFKTLRATAVKALNGIAVGLKFLTKPFRAFANLLTKSIFNLKNLIIVIAAAAFVRRAKEVEAISIAFDNLSNGIGLVASDFLPALRKALKGTVSDLELMRTTNNAMLLGVVKSQEQFTELAVVARRLGRAVGRNAVDALNDLAIGIGRQSRLILDNLGIIISVQKAYDTFAASLGKTADELTDTQKRQAFLNAVMEQSRIKLKSLGPEVLTVADQWDRLTASINNVIDALATSIVGGDLAGSLADVLDENLQGIVAFAKAAQLEIQFIVTSIVELINKAFGGGDLFRLSLESVRSIVVVFLAVIAETVRFVFNLLRKETISTFKTLGIFAGKAFVDSFDFAVTAIRNAPLLAAVAIRKKLEDSLGLEALGTQDEDTRLTKARLERLAEEARVAGPVADPGRAKRRLQARIDQREAERQVNEAAKSVERILDVIKEQLERLDVEFGEKTSEIPDRAITSFVQFGLKLNDVFQGTFNFVRGLFTGDFEKLGRGGFFRALEFGKTDPIFNFRKIVTKEVLQPIADVLNKLEEITKEEGLRGPVSLESVLRLRKFIGLMGGAVIQVNKLIVAFDNLNKQEFIDPEKFAGILRPFTEQAKKLKLQVDTLGKSLSEASRIQFESVTAGEPQLREDQKRDLENAIFNTRQLAQQVQTTKELDAVGKAILQTRIRIAEVTGDIVELTRLRLEQTKDLGLAERIVKFTLDLLLKSEQKRLKISTEISTLKKSILTVENEIATIGKTQEETARILIKRARERGEVISKEKADQLILLGIAQDRSNVANQVDAGQVAFENNLKSIAESTLQTRIEIAEVTGNLLALAKLRLEEAKNLSIIDKARLFIARLIERVTNNELTRVTKLSELKKETLSIEDRIATVGKTREETARILVDRERELARLRGKAFDEDAAKQEIINGKKQDELDIAEDISRRREDLVVSVTGIIGQGVTEGILRGKIAFKDVAQVGANLFRNFMSSAIEDIGKKLSKVLTNVLGSAGAIGLAGALIGIGGLIISNLQGKTEATIDDFGNQVTSSEAVRGVVAGPTNVAISKVGNQLKDALRVSEGLLLRIANAVESGGVGGGGGAGDTSDNLSVLLSGSTPS